MAQEWKIGDVVKLKSGGPKMTVTTVDRARSGNPIVWCMWFDEKGPEKRESTFPPDALEK